MLSKRSKEIQDGRNRQEGREVEGEGVQALCKAYRHNTPSFDKAFSSSIRKGFSPFRELGI